MSSVALQKSIEGLLSTHGRLPAVYDGVRPTARYPYITLGRERSFYENGQTRHMSHIFVYSQAFSIAEVKKTLAELVMLFASQALVVKEQHLVLNAVRSTEALRLADGKTYRGELVLETILETNN